MYIYILDQLLEFKQRINEVNFLDTIVYKTPTGKRETKLYTKDTDRHLYLHRKSEHP